MPYAGNCLLTGRFKQSVIKSTHNVFEMNFLSGSNESPPPVGGRGQWHQNTRATSGRVPVFWSAPGLLFWSLQGYTVHQGIIGGKSREYVLAVLRAAFKQVSMPMGQSCVLYAYTCVLFMNIPLFCFAINILYKLLFDFPFFQFCKYSAFYLKYINMCYCVPTYIKCNTYIPRHATSINDLKYKVLYYNTV